MPGVSIIDKLNSKFNKNRDYTDNEDSNRRRSEGTRTGGRGEGTRTGGGWSGREAVGFEVVGFEAVGFEAVGFEAVGFEAVGFELGYTCVTRWEERGGGPIACLVLVSSLKLRKERKKQGLRR